MLTRDIHSNKETVKTALYDLEQSIKMAKREPDRLLALVVGYGSKGGSHKIRTAVIEKLNEYIESGFVKGYIEGNRLDIFDSAYQSFRYKDKIPEAEKRKRNPGMLYIAV